MENNYKYTNTKALSQEEITRAIQTHLSNVYAWMFGGLLITAFTAWAVSAMNYYQYFTGPLFWVVVIAQFGLVLGLSGWINKMSVQIAQLMFLAYSFLTGLTFSLIFVAYASSTIYQTFFITSGMFASMSFFGYVTKKDLSGLGRFLFMGLIGLIIAVFLNMFLNMSGLTFLINIAGVLIFAGLTAYDTQKIKEMYVLQMESGEAASKGAIIGALKLYLDFINMFLFLLRLVGGGRD